MTRLPLVHEPVEVVSMDGRSWRLYPHPADQGPPLEDLEALIARAEQLAEQRWRDEHGILPWRWPAAWTPSWIHDEYGNPDPVSDDLAAVLVWPGRWFATHLFELPPLGMVPDRWLDLLTGALPQPQPQPPRPSPTRRVRL